MLCFLMTCLICGFTNQVFCLSNQEEITYPPKQPTTEIEEIVNAYDSLKYSVNDLSETISGDIKKQGLTQSIKSHKKFYSSIFIFGVLTMIWFRNRSRH